MREQRSLKNVIMDFFYDDIFNELSDFIEEHPDVLESKSYIVEEPDEATLIDMEAIKIDISNSQGNEILLDLIVAAEIEIAETVRRNRDIDSLEQWFRISCRADLEDGLNNFEINHITTYTKQRVSNNYMLSDQLIPIIHKDELDDIAEKFLKKYYPEALEKPMDISPDELARRMGLKVKYINITKSCTTFGQIFFSDCKTQYFDRESNEYKQIEVEKGTIFVDPEVFFMRNLGSMNNTVIHECVHWELHKKFFELEKLHNKEARAFRCQVEENLKRNEQWGPFDWMEWHANALAPRILMPARQTKEKIIELIEKNKKILTDGSKADIIESVIFELSEFFGVSKLAAKIRMIDLGYQEAEGVYTYVDDHYILNYIFEENAIRRGQTYTIGIQDALFEYATNLKFREIINSGNYLFVENHFCINDSKYIRFNESGLPQLTDYARQHIDECCFVFNIKARANDKYGVKYYSECILFRSMISNKIIDTEYDDSKHNIEVAQRAKDLQDTARDILSIKNSLPNNFSKKLIFHMKRKNCTVEKLAEKALIGVRTIQRIRNDEDYPITMENVVAICIGLQLHPIFSKDLIEKAGLKFKCSEKHIIYELILDSCYNESIHYCNEILRNNNLPTLGREE